MPTTKKSPEFTAFEAVHSALVPLDQEARRRVLASVCQLLEITDFLPTAGTGATMQQAPGGRSSDNVSRLTSRPVSLMELIQDKAPKTNAERITLYAYYRERHEGISRFSRKDLEEYFRKAHDKPPTNYDRDFVEAVKKGWIHEDKDDSYITSRGIEAAEGGFPAEPRHSTKAAKGRRTAKRKAK